MLVDLHAHYPMHLAPTERELAREHFGQWRKEWVRAQIVRFLSRGFNYQARGDRAGVKLEEMLEGDVGVILSVLYSPFDEIDFTRRYGALPRPGYFTELLDQLQLVEDHIETRRKEGRHATVAHSPAELRTALTAREQVLIHAVEDGFHLGDEAHEIRENVRRLAERGVAYITVAHLFWRGVATNAPALPFMPDWLYSILFPQPWEEGLSALGRAAVEAMIDHGVLIDITHMSERSAIETLDLLDARDPSRAVPVIATHMACRFGSLEYNLSDSVIRRVAERRGLLGLIACKHYISDGGPEPQSFDDSVALLRRHIDRICEVSGSDECVAFGSDLDGYIKPALPGLETLSRMGPLQQELAKHYGPERAEAFTSGNALRVLETAWQRPGPAPPARPPRAPVGTGAAQPPVDPQSPSAPQEQRRGAPEMVAFAVAFVGYLYLVGWLVDRVRLSSARLPAYLVSDAFDAPRLIGDGLRSTALAAGVFALVCLLAYLASWLHWEKHGPLWHDLVRRRRSTRRDDRSAPLGEAAVRILAGFNTVALAALLALAPTRVIDALAPSAGWAIALVWVAAFLLIYFVLAHWAPKIWGGRIGVSAWMLVALASLFASAPLGVLMLASVLIATFGRVVTRLGRPRTVGDLVRSPLPWAVLAVVMLIALAYQAMPPESFPTAVLGTRSGAQSGAYLARTGEGVYLASCASRPDGTSTAEHLSFVPAGDLSTLEVRSRPYRFDSGRRPSLATLVLHALGVEGDVPTWFDADLRARASSCDGAGTEGASNNPALGRGVLAAPGPKDGQARDGEPPIQDTTARLIADLARRYQPTVETTVADRFWPVSLGAVLAERGPNGARTCLIQRRASQPDCEVKPASLSPLGAAGADYLQLPVALASDARPQGQFEAFTRGQGLEPGPAGRWLSDPTLLEPWSTAQVYFYLSEGIDTAQWPAGARNPLVPSGLVGLEYWFYYPYNYYPAAVRAKLMEQAPLAGDALNVDLHQGDWEHIDVLLDPRTLEPRWLYMARHAFEGQFIPWSRANLTLDEGHPIVQAAFGGHPTYQPGCGAQPRSVAHNLLSDWLVCGSGRLAFRASSTPLVDLGTAPWACWPGHFGEASALEIANAGKGETVLDKLRKVVFVAGPVSPLRQAENAGACKADPRASEQRILPRLQAAQANSAAP